MKTNFKCGIKACLFGQVFEATCFTRHLVYKSACGIQRALAIFSKEKGKPKCKITFSGLSDRGARTPREHVVSRSEDRNPDIFYRQGSGT